ncbi:hypothetical protein KC333_g3696 [Hortaea werneckii]|nr:hypothetical protein KC333_g3696 [Hortaea werneckii]KAI7304947.1 hypothetical protein KC326_g8316 [Hortaea werneckii]
MLLTNLLSAKSRSRAHLRGDLSLLPQAKDANANEPKQRTFRYSDPFIEKAEAIIYAWKSGGTSRSRRWSYADLEKWGWFMNPEDTNFNIGPLRATYEALQIRKDSPPNVKVNWGHSGNAEDSKATGAVYTQAFNVASGVVAVSWMQSPDAAIADFKRQKIAWPWPAPKLKRWSDVTFLLWQEHCRQANVDPAGLEWVFHVNISNMETREVIFGVLGEEEHLVPWPGRSFDIDGEEGKRLLGSPNGSGTGWLLADYAKIFLGKVIDRIVVFDPAAQPGERRSIDQVKPCMGIHIADRPADLWQ